MRLALVRATDRVAGRHSQVGLEPRVLHCRQDGLKRLGISGELEGNIHLPARLGEFEGEPVHGHRGGQVFEGFHKEPLDLGGRGYPARYGFGLRESLERCGILAFEQEFVLLEIRAGGGFGIAAYCGGTEAGESVNATGDGGDQAKEGGERDGTQPERQRF